MDMSNSHLRYAKRSSTGNYALLEPMEVDGDPIEMDIKYRSVPGAYSHATGRRYKTRQNKAKTKIIVTRVK